MGIYWQAALISRPKPEKINPNFYISAFVYKVYKDNVDLTCYYNNMT